MKKIRYLIFDLDGTLIDSSEGIVDAVNYSLRMMAQPEQPSERIKKYIGYPLSQMYADFTDIPSSELYRHFRVRANRSVVESSELLPGVEATLKRLQQQGYKMAIATTKVRCNLDAIIAMFDWDQLFDVTLGGDEVPRIKPEPDIFRMAIEQLGAGPDEALVIGDTTNDILAAQAVPMPVVAVKSPYESPAKVLALTPDHFMESITQLPELLRNGQGRRKYTS